MVAYTEEVHVQDAQLDNKNRASLRFFKDLEFCVTSWERYSGCLTAVAREMYNEVMQLVRDWKR